ncbi:helix-turn-helix domain-containing protein [Enterococcus faecium]|uniref:helix-turn-helix domain-containing protein n=1 Tax=Enterococcus faecium TaxID=1352 RepID=UPI000BF01526|nr:helix-turn-helix transcriptional regulator [Enterococcus faecium]PEH49341.1 transcriptional regulator [Enterococcus faecium]
MNTYEIIKELAKEKKISIRQLEIRFGYSNGYLAKWKTNTPNSDELVKIADYFNVSVDYLLGREKELVRVPASELSVTDTVFSFDGEPIPEDLMRKAIAIARYLDEEEKKSEK